MKIKDFIRIDLLDEKWTSIRIYVDATLALNINLLEEDFNYSDFENFLYFFGEIFFQIFPSIKNFIFFANFRYLTTIH